MTVNNYQYQACDAGGNMTAGVLAAETEREAVAQLQARKLVPVRLKLTGTQIQASTSTRIKGSDLVEFTNGLCTLVDAKVPLDKALTLLEGITEKPHMKQLVSGIRREVKEGKSLADAMEQRPEVFSRLYVNIVRAGETGGILDQLLPDLSAFLEASEETRKQVLSAMAYPMILMVTGFTSVTLLLVFVVPKFTAMFENVGVKIPDKAQLLLDLSTGIKHWWWLLPLFIAGIWYYLRWIGQDAERLRAKHAWMLTLPIFGNVLLYRDAAIFARTLGALLGAGIPLIRGLRVAREVLSNTELVHHLVQVEEDVRGGAGLGVALAKSRRFPLLLHQLVTVGEETGRTSGILKKLAHTFDTYVRDEMNRLVSALQPLLILVMGIGVGGIIIIMLSAVFSMNTLDF